MYSELPNKLITELTRKLPLLADQRKVEAEPKLSLAELRLVASFIFRARHRVWARMHTRCHSSCSGDSFALAGHGTTRAVLLGGDRFLPEGAGITPSRVFSTQQGPVLAALDCLVQANILKCRGVLGGALVRKHFLVGQDVRALVGFHMSWCLQGKCYLSTPKYLIPGNNFTGKGYLPTSSICPLLCHNSCLPHL